MKTEAKPKAGAARQRTERYLTACRPNVRANRSAVLATDAMQ